MQKTIWEGDWIYNIKRITCYIRLFIICTRVSLCVTKITIFSVGWKKELASMHLFEFHFLIFFPSPFALNRNSIDGDEPPTDSLPSEYTLD